MTTTAGTTTISPPSALPRPSALVLWGRLEHPQSARALALALGEDVSLLEADAPALEAALATGRFCAVIWADPASVLAEALAQGTSPRQALTDWQDAAGSLLRLYRRNRRQLVLLSEAALSSSDPETLAQLQARLGIKRPPAPPVPAPTGLANLAGLLAESVVCTLEQLRPLLAELEASSIHCPRPASSPERLEQAGEWLMHQRSERSLLQDQIRLLDQALVSREAERAATLAELEQSRAEARSRTEAELLKLRDECDRLRQDTRQLAETRAHAKRQADDLARSREALVARERELADLHAWNQAIFASNSWKVTAPLRKISLMLGRHKS